MSHVGMLACIKSCVVWNQDGNVSISFPVLKLTATSRDSLNRGEGGLS